MRGAHLFVLAALLWPGALSLVCEICLDLVGVTADCWLDTCVDPKGLMNNSVCYTSNVTVKSESGMTSGYVRGCTAYCIMAQMAILETITNQTMFSKMKNTSVVIHSIQCCDDDVCNIGFLKTCSLASVLLLSLGPLLWALL